jgi:hypothetical protein
MKNPFLKLLTGLFSKRGPANGRLRIIHLPTTVGGNPQGLSRHLNEVGVESESWTLSSNYFGYAADKVIWQERDHALVKELKRLWALRYLFVFDAVFFNFGGTLYRPHAAGAGVGNLALQQKLVHGLYDKYARLMQQIELHTLRWLRRPILIQYQGDDARQGDYCRANYEISIANAVDSDYYTPASDALKREQIALLSKYCAKIYALNPDLLHVLPKGSEFLPYSHISLKEWQPFYTQMEDRPLRIGHAPSHRGAKGTNLVLTAFDQLKRKGFVFETLLIEGVSNKEAKEMYAAVDIMVDQLFAGWYGGLAVEAMALGKPVLAYIRESDLIFIPREMRSDLPIINVTPSTIESTLRTVLEMPRERLLILAKRSRAYVEKWHDPLSIAIRIKRDLEQAMEALRK